VVTLPFAFELSGGGAPVARGPAPPQRPEPGGVLQLADVDRQPELANLETTRRMLETGYPPLLRDAGVQGSVVVSMVVDTDGTTRAASVISTSHDAFREPALAAVAAMRFRPAQRGGRAVPVRLSLPIEFRLSTGEMVR
jgi:protein TonB